VLSLLLQSLMFLLLSLAKNRVELAKDKSVSLSLYIILAIGVFHIGHQCGAGGNYFRYHKECDLNDAFQVKKRLDWHGTMIFHPCVVAVLQCFIFFPSLFSLIPFFKEDLNTCPTNFLDTIGTLDDSGTVYFISTMLTFLAMMSTLVWMCLTHFEQFKKYQKLVVLTLK